MKTTTPHVCPAIVKTGVALLALSTMAAFAQSNHTIFPLLPASVSTVPSNGDLNPYGVAFAPKNLPAAGGILQPGDLLVSNFNNNNNLQGTGTTIVRIDKNGQPSIFYTAPTALRGLTAALGVLSNGMVLIGSLPTADGTAATAGSGYLAVLDRNGDEFLTIGTPATVNGPWGMAIYDTGNGVTGTAHVFVSNAEAGSISRFDIAYGIGVSASVTLIASGLDHRFDPAALVLGPSGLAYDSIHDTLYFASSVDNAVFYVTEAVATSEVRSASLAWDDPNHLHGPLGLTYLPNGHFVVAQSDGSNVDPNQPSELVEYSAAGVFLGQMSIDPNNGGAFGVSAYNLGWGTFRMAAVDDNTNSVRIWTAVAQ
jgi:hypothetical protein